MNIFFRYFSNKTFQRIFYFILLLTYNILIFSNGDIDGDSSIGISFVWFWLIPTIVLIYQTICNNKIGWLALFLLYILYMLWTTISIIEWTQDSIKFNIDYFLQGIPIFLILFAFGWVLYLIRPAKHTTKTK